MKYLCILLAFLVLTLSVQPVCASVTSSETCCSESACSENQDTNAESESQKDCANGCNPFQICGCCAFSVVPVFQPGFIPLVECSFVNAAWATLNCSFVEEPVLGLWQPPKLLAASFLL